MSLCLLHHRHIDLRQIFHTHPILRPQVPHTQIILLHLVDDRELDQMIDHMASLDSLGDQPIILKIPECLQQTGNQYHQFRQFQEELWNKLAKNLQSLFRSMFYPQGRVEPHLQEPSAQRPRHIREIHLLLDGSPECPYHRLHLASLHPQDPKV